TRDLTATGRGSKGAFDYSLEGGVFRSDWFSVGARNGAPDARKHETLSARLGYEPSESWRTEGIFRWVEVDREEDNFDIEDDRNVNEVDYATRLQAIHDPRDGVLESIFGVSRSGNANNFYTHGVATGPRLRQSIT